jgi:hypothetical protein
MIDINRHNNGVLPMENVQQEALPHQDNLDVLPEGHGISPEAPAARNVHLCVVCNTNEIDCFLQCGHPFCTHCIAATFMLLGRRYVQGAEHHSKKQCVFFHNFFSYD